MIPTFAWRNLWRNKLRSALIIAAFTIGIFAGVFLIAFMSGMINSRVNAVIGTEMSHIQLHKKGFLENNQFSIRFDVSDTMLGKIAATPHVVAVSKRIIVNSMIASAETGMGVKISGIDPTMESKVTNIHSNIIEGKYLDEKGRNPVLISESLAKKLNVSLKNKIVITLQDVNKTITGGAFRIVGIYRTENLMFDDGNIFVRNEDLARLTGISVNEAHEVAVLLDKNDNTEAVTQLLSNEFPKLDVKNWLQLSPDAGALVGMMNQYTYIFTVIILLALCFGIVNTMLMVIMERIHELGMLMAIGMKRIKVFGMILLETVFLSLTGGMLGILLGWLVTNHYEKTGIDLYFWKEAFGQMGFSSMIYPSIDNNVIFYTAVMVIIAGVLSAIYPAYKAIKLKPVEAIRTI
ncbi:MAG: ABC transporter permease [Paludibacter sp.]|nr:ABC transporter permease [Paludibacter sp.]